MDPQARKTKCRLNTILTSNPSCECQGRGRRPTPPSSRRQPARSVQQGEIVREKTLRQARETEGSNPNETPALLVRKIFGSCVVFRGERLYEIEQTLTNRRVLDREISLDEFECFALTQRTGFESFHRRFCRAAHRRRAHRVGIVEEERYRHVQNLAQLIEPARPDPVCAALVFLHLLEGQPDRLTELFLAEAEHVAAQSQPYPDADIDRIRRFHLRTARPPRRLRS